MTKTCYTCRYSEYYPESMDLFCMGQKYMPKVKLTDTCDSWKSKYYTNRDLVNKMTNNELAEFISGGCPNLECPATLEELNFLNTCKNCWLNWLDTKYEI